MADQKIQEKPVVKKASRNSKRSEIKTSLEVFDSIIEKGNKDKKMYGFYCDPEVIDKFDHILKNLGYKRNRSEIISSFIENFNNYYEFKVKKEK